MSRVTETSIDTYNELRRMIGKFGVKKVVQDIANIVENFSDEYPHARDYFERMSAQIRTSCDEPTKEAGRDE